MDQLAEKQARINRRRDEMAARYPLVWDNLITEWNSSGPQDRAWLMYSANYLFHTAGVRWALDPLTLKQRLPTAPEVDIVHDLEGLSFILLTHRHKDHLDLELVRALRALPILWVAPETIVAMVESAGLSRAKIIVPKPMELIKIQGLHITPFDGLHWERDSDRPSGLRGVPATGYLVGFNGKRWLFPGDTRTYDATRLPRFGPVDGLFSHLWLGRASALLGEPPLLNEFCRFCIDLQPERIVVTHLDELGRPPEEYWDEEQYKQAEGWMRKKAPDIVMESARMGECVFI